MSAQISNAQLSQPGQLRHTAVQTWFELPRVVVAGLLWIVLALPVLSILLGVPWPIVALAALPGCVYATGLVRFAAVIARGERPSIRDAFRLDAVLGVTIEVGVFSASALLAGGRALMIPGVLLSAILLLVAPFVLGYGAVRGRTGFSAWRGGLILVAYRPGTALTLLALNCIGAFLVVASLGVLGLVVPAYLFVFACAVIMDQLADIDEKTGEELVDALTEVEIAELLDPSMSVGITGTLAPNLPEGELTVEQVRELDRRLAVIPSATGSSEWIRRPDDSRLELRRYLPSSPDTATSRSIVLWIHGGGMFLGSARQDDAACQELCEALGVRVASVDYRLAPEHPYPEPLDDCFTALVWLAERYHRVVVVGASAGGGLAAGLALLARDRTHPRIAAVQLLYPMLDDRETAGARRLANTAVWNARLNRLGWQAYLGTQTADAYAAPARAANLAGLPPVYLDTGELDLFLDEDTAFADGIRAAGGQVEFWVEPGAVHGFDLIAPEAPVSLAAVARRRAWLAGELRPTDGASEVAS